MRPKTFCQYCGNRLSEKTSEGRRRLFCTGCDLTVYDNPIPAACTVIVDANDRLLLVKRNVEPKKGLWCLPGGFMELNETPEQTGLRELREETGLSGKIELLLGVAANTSSRYGTVVITGFLVRVFTGSTSPGDDAEEVRWFDHKDLPEIAFDSHKKFIRIYYAAYANPNP